MKKVTGVFIAVLVAVLWAGIVFSAQGQWAEFIYLIPKEGKELLQDEKTGILQQLNREAESFTNDFDPEKNSTETLQFYKLQKYTRNGETLSQKVPTILIRVESLNKEKVNKFTRGVASILKNHYDLEYRSGVARELNYTDVETLSRLKANAPSRGNGNDQPNAVIFPLSKTPDWWSLTPDKRKMYFTSDPGTLGENALGHNAIGFQYIRVIFRKLYHSRFIDDQQDFITYFEFADKDKPAFESLLNGLRDVEVNPEWKFVKEEPIFWGKRVSSAKDVFKNN